MAGTPGLLEQCFAENSRKEEHSRVCGSPVSLLCSKALHSYSRCQKKHCEPRAQGACKLHDWEVPRHIPQA